MALSFVDYVGNGTTGPYSVPFGYISAAHVTVTVNGAGVSFSWVTSSSIQLAVAAGVGTRIRIKRTTPSTPLVDFVSGSTFTEADLDKSTLQALYRALEAVDTQVDALMYSQTTGKYEANSKVIANVANPASAQDAATKAYGDAQWGGAAAAAAAASAAAAAASESAAATSEFNAAASELLAQNYAVKNDDYAAGTDNSAKSWAIGGVGTGQPADGDAKSWATKVGAYVTGALASAKEWAVGTFLRGLAGGGSAKDWATYTAGTVDDTEYSAKSYAYGTLAGIAGSAKDWAQKIGGFVQSTNMSAKEWAIGVFQRGAPGGGSAKDWANYTGGTVDNTEYSAKKYANDAAASAAGLSLPSITAADKGKMLLVKNDASGYTLERTPRRNFIINGNFDIWQRGFSQTVSGIGSDDRWVNLISLSTQTVSRQSFTLGQTAVPYEPRYYSRTVVTSGVGTGGYTIKQQRVEGIRNFSGETVTLSFYAKCSTTKNLWVDFDNAYGTGGSPSATVITPGQTCALTTSWQKFTVTVTLPSVSGKTLGTNNDDHLAVNFWMDAGTDWNSRTNNLGGNSGTYDFAQIQLEKGSVATRFEERHPAQELILCQRYFEKSYNLETPPGTATAVGAFASFSISTYSMYRAGFTFQVRKRVSPSITPYNHQTGAVGTWYWVNAAASHLVYPVSQCEVGWEPSGNGGWPGGDYTYPQWTASAEL